MSKLSILLCLKGRKKFTKRWLDWMVIEKCPFQIIIADGDANKSHTKDLINDPRYKDLKIVYQEYPEDTDIQAFVKKFNNSLNTIDSEYVICADNDDFIIIENLQKALNYFIDNSETIDTLALSHYRFSINNDSNDINDKIYNKNGTITFQELKPFDYSSFSKLSTFKRLKKSVKEFPSDYFFYSIHKTTNFKKNINVTCTYPIDYMFFWERHLTYSIGIIGNIYSDSSLSPFVVRQEGTSVSASALVQKEKLINIRFTNRWKSQYPNFVRGVYSIYSESESTSYKHFYLNFNSYYHYDICKRLIYGLIGTITSKSPYLYNFLSNILMKISNKSRKDLNDLNIKEENIHIKRLINFLERS